jgi:O-antigen/teichoic acid export membrane protein
MISWHWLSQNRHRVFRWGKIFGGLALTQLLVQVVNAVAGFLLVRTLPKPDYAWFTIASGMSAVLSILSDSGIGSAVTSIGGTVWKDHASLKALVMVAMRLRMQMAALASVLVAGISLWLLRRNGAEWGASVMLTLLVLSPVWCLSTSAVLSVVNRLHSRTRELQIADAYPALLRVVLTFALLGAGWLTPVTALLAVLAGHVFQLTILERQVLPLLGDAQVEEEQLSAHKRAIYGFMRQLMPNGVFVCVQGQLSTWIMSFFASSSEVADLGALNRIAILFAVIGGPVTQFVAPAFARATDKKRLWGIAGGLFLGSTVFCAIMLLAAWLKGDWFLWLLGSKYSHLRQELILMLVGMCIANTSNLVLGLNIARGWIRFMWLNIPLTLGAQAVSMLLFDLSSVAGLAKFVIVSAVVQFCHTISTCMVYLLQSRKELKPTQ